MSRPVRQLLHGEHTLAVQRQKVCDHVRADASVVALAGKDGDRAAKVLDLVLSVRPESGILKDFPTSSACPSLKYLDVYHGAQAVGGAVGTDHGIRNGRVGILGPGSGVSAHLGKGQVHIHDVGAVGAGFGELRDRGLGVVVAVEGISKRLSRKHVVTLGAIVEASLQEDAETVDVQDAWVFQSVAARNGEVVARERGLGHAEGIVGTSGVGA